METLADLPGFRHQSDHIDRYCDFRKFLTGRYTFHRLLIELFREQGAQSKHARAYVFSRFLYWHITDDWNGETRLRHWKDEEVWLVKSKADLRLEAGVGRRALDSALDWMETENLVTRRLGHSGIHNNGTTSHFRINFGVLMRKLAKALASYIQEMKEKGLDNKEPYAKEVELLHDILRAPSLRPYLEASGIESLDDEDSCTGCTVGQATNRTGHTHPDTSSTYNKSENNQRTDGQTSVFGDGSTHQNAEAEVIALGEPRTLPEAQVGPSADSLPIREGSEESAISTNPDRERIRGNHPSVEYALKHSPPANALERARQHLLNECKHRFDRVETKFREDQVGIDDESTLSSKHKTQLEERRRLRIYDLVRTCFSASANEASAYRIRKVLEVHGPEQLLIATVSAVDVLEVHDFLQVMMALDADSGAELVTEIETNGYRWPDHNPRYMPSWRQDHVYDLDDHERLSPLATAICQLHKNTLTKKSLPITATRLLSIEARKEHHLLFRGIAKRAENRNGLLKHCLASAMTDCVLSGGNLGALLVRIRTHLPQPQSAEARKFYKWLFYKWLTDNKDGTIRRATSYALFGSTSAVQNEQPAAT
jgi:hypothetical protein